MLTSSLFSALRLEKFNENCERLSERQRQFSVSLRQEIDDAIKRTPLIVKERKRKVDLDAETPGTEALPPPLIPIAASAQSQTTVTPPTTVLPSIDEFL